ncbi:MAG: excinuclease ABC subunit B [Verrucomicrobia bacterium]|nr:MAG: excinuclease ABC subunit B [Verrucomicrobiota bacterium]
MVCQLCKQKEATVHLTQIVENQVKNVDLCEPCAKQKGVNDPTGFSLADLLLGLGASQEIEQAGDAKGAELKCETCGFTQAELKKTGRLGCAECYTVFADVLDTLLKGMHKGTQHKGKVPAAIRETVTRESGLARLVADLQSAVSREDFESAARLRDEIKTLKADH